ncbi:hypothetical protein [Sphingobium cloacae]|nr:hypothetical protein [Sphingobium cloacae]
MSVMMGMKWSIIVFASALVLGFLGMGALGAALYYACYPLLAPFYGNLVNWHGDWVWSATIWAGVLWPFTFLIAGGLNLYLTPYAPVLLRGAGYVLVLWLGAALIWALILAISYKTPEAACAETGSARFGPCTRADIMTGNATPVSARTGAAIRSRRRSWK